MEEKLKKLIDDLRLGGYDNSKYTVRTDVCGDDTATLTISKKSSNVSIRLCFYSVNAAYSKACEDYLNSSRLFRLFHKYPYISQFPSGYEYFVIIYRKTDDNNPWTADKELKISERLSKTYMCYIRELMERQNLLNESNTEDVFGL